MRLEVEKVINYSYLYLSILVALICYTGITFAMHHVTDGYEESML
jgi:hypothetical protein